MARVKKTAMNIVDNFMVVAADKVHPNTWNANVEDDVQYQAVRDSIRLGGFVAPIIVRKHKKKRGHYEILDGEHRLKGAVEEGYTEVVVNVLVCPVDAEAMAWTERLGTHGVPDRKQQAAIFKKLVAHYGSAEAAAVGLPYTTEAFEGILALSEFPNYDSDEEQGSGSGSGDEWERMVFEVPAAAVSTVRAAIEKAKDEGESSHDGIALERVCADYVAGQ